MIVFDLCGTLYSANTTFDFLRYIRPVYSSFIFSFPMRVFSKLLDRFFCFDLIRFFALRGFRGYSEKQLDEFAEVFFDAVLLGKEQPEVMALLDTHRVNAIIVSASIEPIVKVVSNRLGVSYLSSQLYFIDGVATGVLAVDLLGNKAEHIYSKIELVVTDNLSDLNLVLLSDKAVIISKSKHMRFWRDKLRPQDKIIES